MHAASVTPQLAKLSLIFWSRGSAIYSRGRRAGMGRAENACDGGKSHGVAVILEAST